MRSLRSSWRGNYAYPLHCAQATRSRQVTTQRPILVLCVRLSHISMFSPSILYSASKQTALECYTAMRFAKLGLKCMHICVFPPGSFFCLSLPTPSKSIRMVAESCLSMLMAVHWVHCLREFALVPVLASLRCLAQILLTSPADRDRQ